MSIFYYFEYFDSFSFYLYVSSVRKKNSMKICWIIVFLKSITTLLQLFKKHCDKDWSFYREASILIWSQNSPNSTLIPNFVFFKTYPFLLRFTLRISSSRSLSLWFFAMHIQCKLYIKKKEMNDLKKEVNSSCEKSCQSNSKVKLNNFL